MSAEQPPSKTERRVVTVMFVDLVGFTSFSESRDPEEVRELITRYFDLARDVIERFGGTVDKYIGDAVMAWWGATASREDDAERAVRAALELVERVAGLGATAAVPDLTARVGVMTGEVAVGPGGNQMGLLLGDLVNSASRLQASASPGVVLVDEATARLVESAIELDAPSTHRVKGRAEPLVGRRAVRVKAGRGGRGRSEILNPPFVGRTAELRLLKDAVEATGTERRARLVSIVGQPGVGKSRLMDELAHYVDGLVEDVYWHEGRSPAYGDGLPLWALGEMIRARCGLQETDSREVTESRLAETVARFVTDGDDRWVAERLGVLLGSGRPTGGERAELFAAARLFFQSIATLGTTVLVFEDLHWADPGLLEFIEELVDWSIDHPVMVVTLARPDLLDRRPDWGSGRPGFTSMYLGPLSDREMTDLVTSTVVGMPDEAVATIVEAAGGVPLFAVEMLRSLVADGRLVVTGEAAVIDGELGSIEVPTSVQAVIGARLDRLPDSERELLRHASVLGQSFTVEGLAAAAELPVDKVERLLGALVRHEILQLNRDPRSPERGQYRWVQGVLREVAYGRISLEDRSRLHLRVARYFRGLDDPELAPVAASHYVSSLRHATKPDPQIRTEMVTTLTEAIDRARAVHAYEQVLSLVDTAIEVVEETEPDLAAGLHESAASAAVSLGRIDEADRHVAALRRLAETRPELVHRSVALAGWVANVGQRSAAGIELMEPHLERWPDLSSDPDLARIAVYLARAHLLSGNDREAASLADRAIAAAERFDLIEDVADAMITRGTAISQLQPRHGMALLEGALAICRTHGFTATGLRALANIGYASHDHTEAMAATREAFEEAKRVGDRGYAMFVAANLAEALALWELRLDEASRVLDDAVFRSPIPENLAIRSSIAAFRGNPEEASEILDRAAGTARGSTDPQLMIRLEESRSLFDWLDGRFEVTFRAAERRFEDSPFAPFKAVGMALAAAVFLDQPAQLHRVVEMAATLPPGDLRRVFEGVARAVLAVQTEPNDGLERLRDVLGELKRLGWNFYLLLATAATARLLPGDDPTRRELLEEALSAADEAGAEGLRKFVLTHAG
jgi:class 3 adenylate cyclase/tetratricopeptide (TPR) repeat protein